MSCELMFIECETREVRVGINYAVNCCSTLQVHHSRVVTMICSSSFGRWRRTKFIQMKVKRMESRLVSIWWEDFASQSTIGSCSMFHLHPAKVKCGNLRSSLSQLKANQAASFKFEDGRSCHQLMAFKWPSQWWELWFGNRFHAGKRSLWTVKCS